MQSARPIVTGLLVIVVAVIGVSLALRVYLGRPAEDRLRPEEAVDSLARLRSPLPQPSFLACPPGYCAASEARPSPTFAMPWERLRDYWLEMIADDRRLTKVDSDPERRRLVYIRHTPVLRFPDIVTVEFVQLPTGRAGIALYSRSRYGSYDFTKNRKRVERWLLLLQQAAGAAASAS